MAPLLRRRARGDANTERPGTAELRGGGSRVVIVPALGGKISALELAGRQWLWTDPALDAATDAGAAAKLGGMDECFPTVAACTLSTAVGAQTLPEGGELRALRAETQILTPGGVPEAMSTWHGERHPYRFTRRVRVHGDGQVEIDYEASNDGREPLPFIWSSMPVFPLDSETRILLPHRARVRIASQHGIDLGAPGAANEHQWPHVRLEKRVVDLSRPASVARKYACKLFVDPVGGVIGIEEPPLRLELMIDPREVPDLGILINRRGLPFGAKGRSLNVLALQPGIGAPDSLADALGSWKGAHVLEPGGSRRWAVRWRARRVEEAKPEP